MQNPNFLHQKLFDIKKTLKISPWITSGILHSIEYRDKLYRELKSINPETENVLYFSVQMCFISGTHTLKKYQTRSPELSVLCVDWKTICLFTFSDSHITLWFYHIYNMEFLHGVSK